MSGGIDSEYDAGSAHIAETASQLMVPRLVTHRVVLHDCVSVGLRGLPIRDPIHDFVPPELVVAVVVDGDDGGSTIVVVLTALSFPARLVDVIVGVVESLAFTRTTGVSTVAGVGRGVSSNDAGNARFLFVGSEVLLPLGPLLSREGYQSHISKHNRPTVLGFVIRVVVDVILFAPGSLWLLFLVTKILDGPSFLLLLGHPLGCVSCPTLG
jgi:hypothetical protein